MSALFDPRIFDHTRRCLLLRHVPLQHMHTVIACVSKHLLKRKAMKAVADDVEGDGHSEAKPAGEAGRIHFFIFLSFALEVSARFFFS